MRAIQLKAFGGVENFYVGPTHKPVVTNGAILVAIEATAINRADTLQRKGSYNPPPGTTDIIGLEVAGVVEEVGPEVKDWKKGDHVMALLPGGGYAEYVVIPEKMAIRIPDGMDFITAAGIPEAFLTAYQSLFTIGNLTPNQKVLVHAGASGVGTSAIQLCNQVPGVEVYVTAGSQDKINECKKLGAKDGVNYKEGQWLPKMSEITGGGVDLVIDCVGVNYFSQNLQILKLDGILVIIGYLSGSVLPSETNIAPLLGKRLKVQGTTLRNRSLDYKIKLTQDFKNFSEGKLGTKIRPVIAKVFDWEAVAESHEYMEKNENIGKIILKIRK